MGTITGQYIADSAWIKVNEKTGAEAVRWTPAEALRWINAAQREIVIFQPKAHTRRAFVTPNPGTHQTLDDLGFDDGIVPVDIPCNATSDDARGRAITKRERAWLDEEYPTWRSATSTYVEHWLFDPADPKAFELFPALTGAGKIEMIVSTMPVDLDSLDDAISLGDTYAQAIEWFLLFSFYSKDADYTKSPQSAASYLQLFTAHLGVTDRAAVQSAAQSQMRATGSTGAAG